MSSLLIVNEDKTLCLPIDDCNTVLQVLQKYSISVAAPCGGNGKCGKCTVQIENDSTLQTVLACKTKPIDGMIIHVSDNNEMNICDSFYLKTPYMYDGNGYAVAIDIGTTTISADLIDSSTGTIIDTVSEMNCQKPYGADVITRTQYIIENLNGLHNLETIVNLQISRIAQQLCMQNNISEKEVKIYAAGNTIMQHISAGFSPESITKAPYIPQLLFNDIKAKYGGIQYAPCISGFIGGDITSGIIATNMHNKAERSLLIDLGTNGEMAMWNGKDILCCSVASGPAFEGAGITCGMPSIKGAINHFSFDNGELTYTTIGGADAKGICGSGIIELVALLLRLGAIDESGYLMPPCELDESINILLDEDDDGNGIVYITQDKSIYFTCKDVRQIQLAKAAVASGIKILLEEADIAMNDIEKLYLAGGFGTFLNVSSSADIGMIPGGLVDKTVSIGNSSLAGISLAACSSEAFRELYSVVDKCKYIELSMDKRFNDYFIDNLEFRKY